MAEPVVVRRQASSTGRARRVPTGERDRAASMSGLFHFTPSNAARSGERTRCCRPSRLLRIHQYEQDTARLRAVIDPSVIGGLLHDDVALLEMDRIVVQHHVDLACEDD